MLTPITQAHSPLTRPKCPGSYTYDASPYHYDVSDLNPAKQALRHPIREQFEPLASPTYTYNETRNSLPQRKERLQSLLTERKALADDINELDKTITAGEYVSELHKTATKTVELVGIG